MVADNVCMGKDFFFYNLYLIGNVSLFGRNNLVIVGVCGSI